MATSATSERAPHACVNSEADMLVGLFGGTFDPIHLGHRLAVDELCESVPFDRVHWVLSARPPHKNQVSASIEHRFSMLQIALSDEPRYIADDTEIVRQQKSYTIDTVEAFHGRFPNAHLCVLIGGDSLHSLPTWRRYQDLMQQVNWIVMRRPGYSLKVPSELESRLVESPAELLKHRCGKIWVFADSHYDVSSTQIRAALNNPNGRKQPIVCDHLSPEVIEYIRAQNLYRTESNRRSDKSSLATDNIMNSEQVKNQVVEALEDIKGNDIKVIDIADISDFADFMVVVSGTSDTHVKALARSASDKLRSQGVKPLSEDGTDVGEWVLVDFGDVVLHVMRPEVRDYYDLEKLWDEDVRKLVEQHREDRGD